MKKAEQYTDEPAKEGNDLDIRPRDQENGALSTNISCGDASCKTKSIEILDEDDDDQERVGFKMDHDEHPDDEQLMSLISVVNTRRQQSKLLEDEFLAQENRNFPTMASLFPRVIVIGAVLAVLCLLLVVALISSLNLGARYPSYDCPPSFMLPPDAPEHKNYRLSKDRVYNETEFLETYREDDYDHWGITYLDFKKQIFGWKSKYFAPYLKSGSTIYESASGLGLNLVATLEVLQEAKNITNLHVYGNDFLFESVYTSNRLMDQGLLPAKAKKGRICQGDSMDLYWVPDNAFDLVFTGYIPPLQDPLELELEDDDLWNEYEEICKDAESQGETLAADMKQRQENHYGRWVNEMIRIAKPGAPVIVEQVSMSVCSNPHDWGGVELDYWFRAIDEQAFDVDVDSIVMEEDKIGEVEGRYHVFMRKNGKA